MDLPPAADEEYTQVQREAPPSHLLTKVESFSLFLKHGIKKLESAEFESGDYKWKVIMNLDGDDVSVYLSLVGTSSLHAGWEVNAFFNFFIYNHFSDKYLSFQGKARRFHAINAECGFSKLFTKNSLTEPSNGYIYKDRCVFGAEVFVIKKQPVLVEKVSALNSSSTPYKHEWNISRFSKLDSIWTSEEFSAGGYNWQIMMYPKGNGKSSGHYVSMFLTCVDAKSFSNGKKLYASCLFILRNLLNEENNHSKTVMAWFASSITSSWGYGEFKAIGDMRDPGKGFVVDDCCVLEIQLSVLALHEAPNMT